MSNVFLIPSLMAAGFVKPDTVQVNFTNMTSGGTQSGGATLFELFKQQHSVLLADHRSHSSHSSHRSGSTGGHFSHSSHTSHRSSYGGYETPSTTPTPSYPSYSPPGPSSNDGARSSSGDASQSLFSAPPSGTDKLPSLSGRTKRFLSIVRRVQIGLLAQGVYAGPINGVVGPLTRSALRRFQSDHGLDVTGTITPATLDALKVPTD